MKTTLITACFVSGHLAISICGAADSPSSGSPVIAAVLGKRITAADVGVQWDAKQKPLISTNTPSAGPLENPLNELAARLVREISGDYIEKNDLKATDHEIREFQEHQDRFMAHDRIRRQKELTELDKKLQNKNLSPKEREQAPRGTATAGADAFLERACGAMPDRSI